MNKNKILFIITGGTIDSVWDGSKDTVVVSKHSILPEYFKNIQRNLKFYEELEFKEICMKDSRAITDNDRETILKEIRKADTEMIIITHGTYTMPITAKYLSQHLKKTDKTIVLTGSMVPINGFYFSDGPFNLGYAIAKVQVLPKGVYLCMNTRVFKPKEVEKDTKRGVFYSIFEEKQ